MEISIGKLFEALGINSSETTINVLMLVEGNRIHVEKGTPFKVRAVSPADIKQGFIKTQVAHEIDDEGLDRHVDHKQIEMSRKEYQQRCSDIMMAEPKFKRIDPSVEYQMRCDDATVFFSRKDFDFVHWNNVVNHPKFRSMFLGR